MTLVSLLAAVTLALNTAQIEKRLEDVPGLVATKFQIEEILEPNPLKVFARIKAREAEIDEEKFLELISCESEWKVNAKGDYRSETGEYMAQGILQFWVETFIGYNEFYQLGGKWKNPRHQITLASWMIRDGEIGHWRNCGKKAGFV